MSKDARAHEERKNFQTAEESAFSSSEQNRSSESSALHHFRYRNDAPTSELKCLNSQSLEIEWPEVDNFEMF